MNFLYFSARFLNEKSNEVTISVSKNEGGVHVFGSGPGSNVGHTWTEGEARILRDLLDKVLGDV